MMMAIINLAFEEIKQNAAAYQNKFELMDYVKRTTRYVFKKNKNISVLCKKFWSQDFKNIQNELQLQLKMLLTWKLLNFP